MIFRMAAVDAVVGFRALNENEHRACEYYLISRDDMHASTNFEPMRRRAAPMARRSDSPCAAIYRRNNIIEARMLYQLSTLSFRRFFAGLGPQYCFGERHVSFGGAGHAAPSPRGDYLYASRAFTVPE